MNSKDYASVFSCEETDIYYIEDRVFSEALSAEGIDPEPYFREDAFSAVIVPHESGGFMVSENGEWQQQLYEGYGIEDATGSLLCVPLQIPMELNPVGPVTMARPSYSATDDGQFLLKMADKSYLLDFSAEGDRGTAACSYRSYDAAAGQTGPVAAVSNIPFLRISPGQQLEKAPDGCLNPGSIAFVLPLSRLSKEGYVTLGIRVRDLSDYYTVLARLKDLTKDNLLVFSDNRASDVNVLGLAALIRGIASGFLVLVSLFCGINVFYTLSTNILLRRRDFGILQSIGFTRNDLLRTVAAESAGSAFRALLFGLPAGIGLCYVLHRMGTRGMQSSVFHLPWGALLPGIGLILLLMLAGILYSLNLLKKQTPLEAIRQADG